MFSTPVTLRSHLFTWPNRNQKEQWTRHATMKWAKTPGTEITWLSGCNVCTIMFLYRSNFDSFAALSTKFPLCWTILVKHSIKYLIWMWHLSLLEYQRKSRKKNLPWVWVLNSNNVQNHFNKMPTTKTVRSNNIRKNSWQCWGSSWTLDK